MMLPAIRNCLSAVLVVACLLAPTASRGDTVRASAGDVAILNGTFPETGLLVKPRTIPIDNHDGLVRLRWRGWATSTARARGRATINTCLPDCADGAGKTFRVRLTASVIRRCSVNLVNDAGEVVPTQARVYTHVRFTFVDRR